MVAPIGGLFISSEWFSNISTASPWEPGSSLELLVALGSIWELLRVLGSSWELLRVPGSFQIVVILDFSWGNVRANSLNVLKHIKIAWFWEAREAGGLSQGPQEQIVVKLVKKQWFWAECNETCYIGDPRIWNVCISNGSERGGFQRTYKNNGSGTGAKLKSLYYCGNP